MTASPFAGGVLPRWQDGVIRLIDIAPDARWNGVFAPGMKICTAWLDVPVREGQIVPNDEEVRFHDSRLEEARDEAGQPGLVVDDATFQAILPRGAPRPACLAGYHMSFLHALLGGPWDQPPWRMCLYRLARVYGLGKGGDVRLEALAREAAGSGWGKSGADNWYDPPAACRVIQGRLVLDALLRLSRPNMLVALSCAKVLPPPEAEPFGRAPGWAALPGSEFHDFE